MHDLATLRQVNLSAVRRWRYEVPRERSAIGLFADALQKDLSEAGVDEAVRQSLATVLDELLANVIMHAQEASGAMHLRVRVTREELVAQLRYSANAFDPTGIAAAHLPTSIASANLGGVGIAMVRAMTEEFSYQYRRGENHLRVRLAL